MALFFARNGAGELLARYSFIEPLLEGRRVLEVGAAAATEGASALLLADRGAAAVLSIEADEAALATARAAGRHPFVRFEATALEALRPGAFDLVLLVDGAPLADDPARLLALRRLLADGGHLVTALSAPDGRSLADLTGQAPPLLAPRYEAFVTALTEHFPSVEVATQSATVGYAVVLPPSNGAEPDVSVDLAQSGEAQASAWIAICGDEATGLSGLTLAAMPVQGLLEEAAAARDAARAAGEQGEAAQREASRIEAEALAARDQAVAGLAEAVAVREALAAERQALLVEREASTLDREGLLQDRDAAIVAEAEARAELEGLQRELAVARGEGDALAAARDEAGRVLEGLRSELAGARGEAAGAAERLRREVEAARAGAAAAVERLKGELGGAAERLRGAEALCDAEREAGHAARADADRLGQLLGLRDRELGDLRAQVADLSRRLAEAELEAARVGEDRNRAVTELAERSSANMETQAALQGARSEAQAAKSAVESSLKRADEAEARIEALEEELDERASQQGVVRAEIEAAREKAVRAEAEAVAQVESSRAELEAARGEAARLRGEVDGLREQAVTAGSEAEVALREIDVARGEAARATAALAELRAELTDSRQALEEARVAADAARAETARLAGDGSAAKAEAATRRLEALSGEAARFEAAAASAGAEREALLARLAEAQAVAEAGQASREEEARRAEAREHELREALARTEASRRQAETELMAARQAQEAAEGNAAQIGAELQAARWEKDEIEQRLLAAQAAPPPERAPAGPAPADLSRLRDEAAQRTAENHHLRKEVARLEAVVRELTSAPGSLEGGADAAALAAAEARASQAEARLADLARRSAEGDARAAAAERRAQAAQQAADEARWAVQAAAPTEADPALQKLREERESLTVAVTERDGRIARLQREVADKTDRLGRLAMEMGELKAKGLGKIFR